MEWILSSRPKKWIGVFTWGGGRVTETGQRQPGAVTHHIASGNVNGALETTQRLREAGEQTTVLPPHPPCRHWAIVRQASLRQGEGCIWI